MPVKTSKAVVEYVTPWFLSEALSGLTVPASRRARRNDARPSTGPANIALQPLYRSIAEFVAMAIQAGELPVSIAGDCCAAIPVVAGLQITRINRPSTLNRLIHDIHPGVDVHVHFDCDVINPDEAPAQSYPVPGGSSATEVADFFKALRSKVNLVAVSVCAWNPAHDHHEQSRNVCLNCLDALLVG